MGCEEWIHGIFAGKMPLFSKFFFTLQFQNPFSSSGPITLPMLPELCLRMRKEWQNSKEDIKAF